MSGQSLDWGDDKLKVMTTRINDWYKCNAGHRDIIKIVGKCDVVYRHNWQEPGKKFRTCMCSFDDHGACPVCDRAGGLAEHQRQMCYATTVLHLFRVPISQGAQRLVGRLLAWRFGDDKRSALLEINEVTNGRLMQVPLSVTLQKQDKDTETFQKLIIQNLPDLSRYPMSKEQQAGIKELLGNQEVLAKIRELYHPPVEVLNKMLKIEEEATAFEPQDFATAEGGSPNDAQDFLDAASGLGKALDAGEDPLKGVL